MQYLVNGIVIGSMYGLIAVAYTMIYGIVGLVNFAFGGIFMFGAFGALVMIATPGAPVSPFLPSFGLPVWAGVIGGIVVGVIVGLIVERIAYRPLRGRPVLTLLVASLAALIMLQSLGQFVFGAGQASYPELISGQSFRLLGAVVTQMDVLVIAVAAITMVLFGMLVTSTSFGRAMRATAQDPDTARLMGIDVNGVVVAAFALGSALAALSGIMYAAQYQFADATIGFIPGLKGLVAAVLGGIGNLPGAFVGGMLLGVIETFAAAYVPQGSAYQDVVAFAVLVLILWVRPQGLFGARVGERA
jgi:branched-subunit amino acid ABC-type transport system permease component